jgi:hypothetical protein
MDTGQIIGIWFFNVWNTQLICQMKKWRVLEQAHRKRNLAEYEGIVDIELT